MITSFDPGIASWMARDIATGVPTSCSPTMTCTGQEIAPSRSVRLMFGMACQQPMYPAGLVVRIICPTRFIIALLLL